MKVSSFSLLTTILVAFVSSECYAAPVVVGLGSKHPLSEAQVGKLLLGELQCLNCHGPKGTPQPLSRTAPNLSDVGSRVAPEYLRKFIACPSAAHSGTTMPDLLMAESEDERNKIADAITHFLVAQSPRKFRREVVEEKAAVAGKNLFHAIGCIACHSPRDDSGNEVTHVGVVELGHIPAKYSLPSLSEFLFQPLSVRTSGRMPDMKLSPIEAKALASYLLGKADAASHSLQPRDELVALGKKYFQQFNCAACHKLGDLLAAAAEVDLQRVNLARGCLALTSGKAPRFRLSSDQIKAIRAAIGTGAEQVSDKEQLAQTLTAFNCIGCHTRDGYGGVSAERDALFLTSATNLGDDGRIPPPLTQIGGKLQPLWIKKVLFDAEGVRPYMFTRMPQYGEPNLRHLPAVFSRLDPADKFEFSMPDSESDREKERTRAQEMRKAGRELLGNSGLNCVACHNFNGKTPQNSGVELMTTHQRLTPGWFNRYLRDPLAYRPRTVMPIYWPEGKAVHKGILNGDTERQIEAIWYFLSLGTSAPDPAGVLPTETKLFVTDATRTYRGRSSVAGYRGIAVGFPEKMELCLQRRDGNLVGNLARRLHPSRS